MKWTKSIYRWQGTTHIQYESEPISVPDCERPLIFIIDEREGDNSYRDVGFRTGNYFNRLAYSKAENIKVCMEWCRELAKRCYDVDVEKDHTVEDLGEIVV